MSQSLGKVLKGFNKTIQSLDRVTKANDAKVQVNRSRIYAIREENASLETEAKQATRVKENLEKLLAGGGL